ncbi:MAG: hypothetical protein AAGD32_04210 [Planctomycetota bacterium]
MKLQTLTRPLVLAAATILTPVLGFGAPLADRVPAQTNVYVGWSGNEAMVEKIEGTPAGNLLDASNLPAVLDVLVPRIADRIAREDERAGELVAHIGELVEVLADKPGALFFGGIGENAFDPGEPAPRIGLIIDAGDEVLEVRGRFEQLFRDFDQDILRALLKNDDRYVMMYFGYEDLEMVEAANGAAALADDEQFVEATTSVGDGAEGGRDVVTYIDVQGLLRLIDDAVANGDDLEAQQNWPILRDTLGLSGIEYFAASAGFDAQWDGLWNTRAFLKSPAPRSGLLGFNDGSLDTALLAAVPQDANFVNANKFDLQAFFDTLKATATAIDPEADAGIRQGLGFANLFVGRNIERDIFQQLGSEWAVYRSDSVATGIGGWIAVNKVKDEDKLRTSLVMLGTALVNGARSQIGRDDPIDFDARRATIDGVDVYYLGTPVLSPSFAVKDGYLFAALQPQSAAAAANAMDAGGSILDNPAFQQYAMSMQAEGTELRGVQFYDVPTTAPKAYAVYIALTRGINGGADLFKVDPIDPILPTLPTLLKNLTPGGGVTYATEDGIRFESVGTFPGANMLLADPADDEFGLLLPLGAAAQAQ